MQFRVNLPQFQGPLELLTSLSIERDLPLDGISLAAIAHAYRTALRAPAAGGVPLSEVGDFALLEARLIRLKAGWRRPGPELPEEDLAGEQTPRRDGELVQAALFLRSRLSRALFLHPAHAPLATHPVQAIAEAMERIDRRAKTRIGRRARLRAAPRVQFRQVLAGLRQALRERGRIEVAAWGSSRGARVLELVAALELTRLGEATLEQEQFLRPIYISRRGAERGGF